MLPRFLAFLLLLLNGVAYGTTVDQVLVVDPTTGFTKQAQAGDTANIAGGLSVGTTLVVSGLLSANAGLTVTTPLTIDDATTATKVISIINSSATAATTLTIAGKQSTSQTLSIPNITAADTLATLGLAQTFTNNQSITVTSGNGLTISDNGNAGFTGVRIANATAGTASTAALQLASDTATATHEVLSSLFSPIGVLIANSYGIINNGAGGFWLAANNASGGVRIAAGGTTDSGGWSSAGVFNIPNTTSATTSLLGAVVIGNGTAATSIGMGAGNINLGGTLTVGSTVYIAAGTIVGPAGSVAVSGTTNAVLGLNANTGNSAIYRYYINSAQVYQTAGSATSWAFTDSVNGWNPLLYTPGLVSAGIITFNGTLSASSSTAGAVVIGNGTAATSVAFGGGNGNLGGTLIVGGATTINNTLTLGGATAQPQFQISPTGANDAVFVLNAPTGQVPRIKFQVNGTAQFTYNTAGGTFNFTDVANTTTPSVYTAGTLATCTFSFAGTLAATSSTAASVKFAGGVGINGALWVNSTTMIASSTAFANGAGSSAGTLTTAPSVGNPTKWIPINDAGTTRYIPAW